MSVLDESGPTVLETELCLERPADWQTVELHLESQGMGGRGFPGG